MELINVQHYKIGKIKEVSVLKSDPYEDIPFSYGDFGLMDRLNQIS